MRHLAWLAATPEGSKKSRLASLKEQDENSSFLKLPDIDGAEYLVALVHEAGLFMTNGMGAIPLTWQEIESWLRVNELPLSLEERLLIKALSDAYVTELNQASTKDRPAPFVEIEEEEIDRKAVSDKIRNVFKAFKRNPDA